MPYHTLIWKIKEDIVDIYNTEKHRLPCWNCIARPTCFSEKKATKRANYLRYTLNFKEPCIESILALNLIECANSDLITTLEWIDRTDIPELFDTAVTLYNSSRPKSIIAGIAMFICVTQRDPNYIRPGNYTAYHYLGYLYHGLSNLKQIDLAIELYSKGIELTPEEPSIIENRGFCFLLKDDLKNARNDFERAKKIDGGCHPDLANIINDIKNRQRGLRGNGNSYHQINNPPKTLPEFIAELMGIPLEEIPLMC
jgi:tetratricopeptide (TPR) repeat protein